jgi:hypothetical protein
MSRLQDVLQRGTRAAQPLATSVPIGTLYYVTDETVLERSDGTNWQSYSASVVAGGITQLTGDVTAGPGSGSQAATIGAAKVTSAMLRNSAAISVIGRSANSAGVPADIAAVAASDSVLRESGSTIGFGTIATAGIADAAVTDAKISNRAALSVFGRAVNSIGVGADIVAAAGDTILRRTGTAVDFGALTVGMAPANLWTYAKLQQISVTSRILGLASAGPANIEELTLSQILDFIGSAAQGDILYRDAATWARLGAGTSGQFLKTQGAGANPVWAAAGGSSEVLRARIVITDAQIKSLNTVPIEIVAAPAAGIMISPISLWIIKESTAGAYSANASIRLRWAGITTDLVTASNVSLAVTNKTINRLANPTLSLLTVNPFATALQISSSADVTGGNAANYMVCDVVYTATTDGP